MDNQPLPSGTYRLRWEVTPGVPVEMSLLLGGRPGDASELALRQMYSALTLDGRAPTVHVQAEEVVLL